MAGGEGMTTTQRLAPMLRWAAECAERGDYYSGRALSAVYTDVASKSLGSPQYCVDESRDNFDAQWFGYAWAYAIAYVLIKGVEQ